MHLIIYTLLFLIIDLSSALQWAQCAGENGYCQIPPGTRALVRYGSGDRWTFKEVDSSGMSCSNGAFGDPYPGPDKVCLYTVLLPTTSDNGTWTHCANEYNWCPVPAGSYKVRFGIGSSWTYRIVEGGINCDRGVFGDPISGPDKVCEYSSITEDFGQWIPCGNEYQNCGTSDANAITYIKFGYPGRQFWYREVQGATFPCTTAFFNDPVSGADKFCYIPQNPPSQFVELSGSWKLVESCTNCLPKFSITEGWTSSSSITKSSTWTTSLEVSYKAGFSFMGASEEVTVTGSISESITNSMEKSFSHSASKTCEASCEPAGNWYLYQWSLGGQEVYGYNDFYPFSVDSCHWICQNTTTPKPPKCPLSYCANSDCSVCMPYKNSRRFPKIN